jgi:hypothetical protein
MLVAGEWQLHDDRVVRPIIRAKVLGSAGTLASENFLVDNGADRTVLSAVLLARLQLPTQSADPGGTLSGIGEFSPPSLRYHRTSLASPMAYLYI